MCAGNDLGNTWPGGFLRSGIQMDWLALLEGDFLKGSPCPSFTLSTRCPSTARCSSVGSVFLATDGISIFAWNTEPSTVKQPSLLANQWQHFHGGGDQRERLAGRSVRAFLSGRSVLEGGGAVSGTEGPP